LYGELSEKDQKERIEALIQENNLSSLMADCLQKKVKNLHSKEILMMEKEFNMNYEKLKQEMESVYKKDMGCSKEEISAL